MSAKELYGVFGGYGRVDEVVIPEWRNKHGCKFGFVRFFEVPNMEM